jgi:hypothetical protein
MSRPALTLTDDQARALLHLLSPIVARHPAQTRNHRPFVREFVRAVYEATGRTFSPTTYRRLLDAYAPAYRPSTNTLDEEKNALLAALDQEARAARDLQAHDGRDSHDLGAVVQRAVAGALSLHPARTADAPSDRYAQAQLDYVSARLAETELALQQSQSLAASLAGELHAAHAARNVMQNEVDACRRTADAHSKRIEELTTELAGARKFALLAVDGVRGETRAWRERCERLEDMMKQKDSRLEYFRQAAYRQGAMVPPDLVADKSA